ncbi:Kae1-associated kinase Bud32 [Candidatus Parvarchaeota archaeon]|jgi:Kae1-associated kinase Bud32|nr:MAG: Kae1-associated kinase Bud32 [Candidatus Parvarchaeota archaeon]HIG52157.1 Kae1-associated serine/threonine protein kinase [Candidatus Pacearchaeota archaeon]
MEKIIARGAEAIIIKSGKNIIKKRIEKGYREPSLDEKIRKRRNRKETKLLEKANKIIPTPEVIESSEREKEIKMSFISGKRLSESLDNLKEKEKICEKIGENIAKLHDNGIIHGDLTTSNMLWKKDKVFFIDFGLGFQSEKIEDKAVDIHLIKQALEAKHSENYKKLFLSVLKGYSKSEKNKEVLERLKKVEKRGRYKH